MHSAVKAVFEQTCSGMRADAALAKKIHAQVMGFINRNKDHTEFFGGNLTGVHVVRFVETDKNRWFDEILDADEEDLRDRLYSHPEFHPVFSGPNGVFQVSGDPFNLSCVWLMHRFYRNTELPLQQRHQAMQDIMLMLQFKFLTSRLFRHFPYPADKAVAEATYAQLTNKFSLKVYGSWLAVLNHRAQDVISNTSIHFEAITRMDSDELIKRMLNDVQGRIRDMLKNIYNVFAQVYASGSRITSTSSVTEFDGAEVLKDRTRGLATYSRYLKTVVSDKNSFIREELLRVVEAVMRSAPPQHTRATLEYISAHYLRRPSDKIDELLDAVMIHSFSYLAANRAAVRANIDLAGVLSRLRGVYTSSRSTDPELMNLRTSTERIVRQAVDTRTDSVVASVRTAVLLYLVARAYAMRHYTSASQ